MTEFSSVKHQLPRDEFVKDAMGAALPEKKRFKARIPFALAFYYLARWALYAVAFSMWPTLGGP